MSLYSRGPRSGPGSVVPTHQRLTGPIRPTRRHITASLCDDLHRDFEVKNKSAGKHLFLSAATAHVMSGKQGTSWQPYEALGKLRP
jgi:hypothetical protein